MQETQPQLDTFPNGMPFFASQTSIFNPSDHTDTALTRCYGSLQWPDCELRPFRDVSSKEPTGDPVNSDPDVSKAEAALSELTVLSHKDFDILHEILTVFTHLACSRKIYLNQIFGKDVKSQKEMIFSCFALHSKQVVYLKGC